LIYVQKITLIQALNSDPVSLVTLDGRKISVAMDEIIAPQTVKLVKGEGMPIYDKNDLVKNILFKEKRGNLYIKFDIVFPKFIDPAKKEEITRLLEN
jgi:DnaJ-class molecular chaperone